MDVDLNESADLSAFQNSIDRVASSTRSDEKKRGKNTSYLNKKKPSIFLLTVNPNLSYHVLNVNSRRAVTRKLLILAVNLQHRFNRGELLKKHHRKVNQPYPKLTNWKPAVEIAPSTGFIHMHILAKFDDSVLVNVEDTRTYLKQLAGIVIYFNARHSTDITQMLEDYVEKDDIAFNDVIPNNNVNSGVASAASSSLDREAAINDMLDEVESKE